MCVRVLAAPPCTPPNVLPSGLLQPGSLSRVLQEPLRRVTFSTIAALGSRLSFWIHLPLDPCVCVLLHHYHVHLSSKGWRNEESPERPLLAWVVGCTEYIIHGSNFKNFFFFIDYAIEILRTNKTWFTCRNVDSVNIFPVLQGGQEEVLDFFYFFFTLSWFSIRHFVAIHLFICHQWLESYTPSLFKNHFCTTVRQHRCSLGFYITGCESKMKICQQKTKKTCLLTITLFWSITSTTYIEVF